MTRHEASQKGGLALKAKVTPDYYRDLGKTGGRPKKQNFITVKRETKIQTNLSIEEMKLKLKSIYPDSFGGKK